MTTLTIGSRNSCPDFCGRSSGVPGFLPNSASSSLLFPLATTILPSRPTFGQNRAREQPCPVLCGHSSGEGGRVGRNRARRLNACTKPGRVAPGPHFGRNLVGRGDLELSITEIEAGIHLFCTMKRPIYYIIFAPALFGFSYRKDWRVWAGSAATSGSGLASGTAHFA